MHSPVRMVTSCVFPSMSHIHICFCLIFAHDDIILKYKKKKRNEKLQQQHVSNYTIIRKLQKELHSIDCSSLINQFFFVLFMLSFYKLMNFDMLLLNYINTLHAYLLGTHHNYHSYSRIHNIDHQIEIFIINLNLHNRNKKNLKIMTTNFINRFKKRMKFDFSPIHTINSFFS